MSSLTDHIGAITGVAFSPNGRTLASGSRDNTVRLWDLTDLHHPTLLVVLTYQATTVTSTIAGTAVAFSPDGHTLASGSDDVTIRLWDTDPEQTARDICALIVTPLTRAQWQQYIPGQS